MIRLVCYDITENKVRSRFAALLEYQGFERIQLSVFVGKIHPKRWPRCHQDWEDFFKKNCEATDRVYSPIIEKDHFAKMAILGHGIDTAWILHENKVFFL